MRTSQRAERIALRLKELGFNAAPLHAKLSQGKRLSTVSALDDGSIQVVVSTDAVARGLDITDLDYVVNLDIPSEPLDYVHRAGRTGRAGREGTSINMVSIEPQLIELRGKTVELSERHFMGAIESETMVRVERRKVAGPWKDTEDPVLEWSKERSMEHAVKLVDEGDLSTKGPGATLRNFEGGKYENAIKAINEKRARRGKVIKQVKNHQTRTAKSKGRSWVHDFK